MRHRTDAHRGKVVERDQIRGDVAMASAILALGIILSGAGQHLMLQWQHAATRHQPFRFEEILGLCASVAGLALVAWWVLSLVAAVAAVVLRCSGLHDSAAFACKLSPAFMRRLVIVLLGLNLAGVPLANAAAVPVDPAWRPTAGPVPAVLPAENDSTAKNATPGSLATDGTVQPPGGSQRSACEPQWRPTAPVPEPGLLATRTNRGAEQSTTPRAAVVVAPGDSLWSIAARHLGPLATDVEVAPAWPLWHEANLSVIGNDPNALLPGQILQPPSQAASAANPRT